MRTCRALVFVILASPTLVSCSSERPLSVVQASAPNYPRVAQLAHIEGDIVVAIDIAPDGRVSTAAVVSGPALREIREGSLAAARQWVFTRSSKQLRKEELTFEFKIEGKPNQDGQEVKFLPPNHLVVSVHPVETEDPTVAITHPKHR